MVRTKACPEGEVRSEIPGKDVSPPPLNARPMGRQDSPAGNSSVVGRKEAGHSWLLSCRQSLPISHLHSLLLKDTFTGVTLAPHTAGAKHLVFVECCHHWPGPITCLSRHRCSVPTPRAGVKTGWLQEKRQHPPTPSSQSQSPQSC